MSNSIFKKIFAELVGTFILVFMGCGSAVLAGNHIGFLGISLAFGLSLTAMAYTVGPISGCHLNPAVTISMLAVKKINGKEAIGYIIGQTAGAIAASYILYFIASGNPHFDLAVNGLGQNGVGSESPDGFSLTSSLVSEIIFSCIFLLVIHGVTSKTNAPNRVMAGLIIGLTLTLIHIVGIPVTGVSVNPARSLGPALLVGGEALSNLWVFIVGPILGGLLGAAIWILLDKQACRSNAFPG